MANPHTPDANRDPITGAPGSHPVGTGIGAAGGATAGALVGAPFGPIGLLVGGAVGAIAGGMAGHGVAEQMDPTAETDYWRESYQTRPYYRREYDFDTDYSPAYTYGASARSQRGTREWDSGLESDLREGWEKAKGKSRMSWEEAKDAVRDAWDRSDRTYRTYETTDRHYADRFATADYRSDEYSYNDDYRPAYRYGTYARSQYPDRQWDDRMEQDLASGWDRAKGGSRLTWDQAKAATRDAWHGVERAIPGDADRDGR